jgi:hypothetical protein
MIHLVENNYDTPDSSRLLSLPDNTYTAYCCNTVYSCCWCLKTDKDNATDNVTEADLIDEANETDEAQIIV